MEEFDRIRQHYREFWAMENETPILLLRGDKGKPSRLTPPDSVERCWLDTEYVVARERESIENTAFFGDAFPLANPNLGPDIFGATFGTDLIFEKETSYSVPIIDDSWSQELRFSEENKWWKKILEITGAMVDDSRGDYLVGVTDLHAGADGLVSLRGPEKLCYDVFDQPEVFEKTKTVLLPAFQRQFEELFRITQKYQTGTANWMSLYNEKPWYVTSSDFICMVSEDHFEELILPEIIEEARYLNGQTIFHLDGPGALRHLDRLLEVPEIHGIQWVYGAGQPSACHWMPVLKKIQAAGKAINILLEPEDIEPIFTELKPQGLSCSFNFWLSEEDAGDLCRKIQGYYKA